MTSNNKIVVPEAKAAMEKFKMEAANEVGVNLKQGYNGDLSSREAGSVGGQMVKEDDRSVRKFYQISFSSLTKRSMPLAYSFFFLQFFVANFREKQPYFCPETGFRRYSRFPTIRENLRIPGA